MNPSNQNNTSKKLFELITANDTILRALELAESLELPNWHIGAGCIAQTVWNHFHGFEPGEYINDIDFVYFDQSDLSYEKENEIVQLVKKTFQNFPLPLDVKNQARVHLWYKDHFGYSISPYESIYDAIKTWPTTATSIAVNLSLGKFSIYAPFGLDDLFNLIVRPNKAQITEEIYNSKVIRWTQHWKRLTIIPW